MTWNEIVQKAWLKSKKAEKEEKRNKEQIQQIRKS